VSLRVEWNNVTVTYSGDTIPLQTFVDFASGSDAVIHESVGPIYDFSFQLPAVSTNILTNHTNQYEVGAIFQAIQPRLAIASHLDVNDYSVVPIVSAIRQTFPTGPLAIAKDFDVWDISPGAVATRQFVPNKGNWGYIFQPETPIPGYNLPIGPAPPQYTLAVRNDPADPRPAVVQPGNLAVFQLPGDSLGSTPAADASATGGR
jgi:hypothetical protein